MIKGPFSRAEFIPTEWSTAAEKAVFGNTLLHFLDSGCPRELFTKKFYTRLSMTFGNIAPYTISKLSTTHGSPGTDTASDEPDLPYSYGLYEVADGRSGLIPEEDESRHGLATWLRLLAKHFLAPSG